MYHNTRPMFKNSVSNVVRAINVHQLDRINWKTDGQDKPTQSQKTEAETETETPTETPTETEQVLDENSQLSKNVEYRQAVRNRDIKDGKIGALLEEYNSQQQSIRRKNYPPEIFKSKSTSNIPNEKMKS